MAEERKYSILLDEEVEYINESTIWALLRYVYDLNYFLCKCLKIRFLGSYPL